MIKDITPDDFRSLVTSSSYNQFIHLIMSIKSRRGRTFTYAELARKLGFKSRSYIRDIVTGSKKITPKLATQFCSILGLTKDLSTLFDLLVQIETEKDNSESQKLLKRHKARMLQSLNQVGSAESAYSLPEIPMVYAALGERSKGATIEEIASRTTLRKEIILKALSVLIDIKLAKLVHIHYLPLQDHVSFERLRESNTFKQHFMYLSKKSSSFASESFDTNQKLFFCSSFSVKSSSIPKLKNELHQILLQYVDKNEVASGDKVISIVCSLF